jgi:hypothetical protein
VSRRDEPNGSLDITVTTTPLKVPSANDLLLDPWTVHLQRTRAPRPWLDLRRLLCQRVEGADDSGHALAETLL